jgi:hypothetical protein
MSARRLSIERRTTLHAAGGDAGGEAAAAIAAEAAGAALPVDEGFAATDAVGSGCAEAGCAGGASFEHAAATRATATKVGTRVM